MGSVTETIDYTERIIGGKTLSVTITRRVGLCEYTDINGKAFLADEATIMDWGTKLSITRIYVMHPEKESTEAEREAGRERIREIVAQVMTEQGLW